MALNLSGARPTGPIKNVKNMLSGMPVANAPRPKVADSETVSKVKQSIAPVKLVSKGSSTMKGC